MPHHSLARRIACNQGGGNVTNNDQDSSLSSMIFSNTAGATTFSCTALVNGSSSIVNNSMATQSVSLPLTHGAAGLQPQDCQGPATPKQGWKIASSKLATCGGRLFAKAVSVLLLGSALLLAEDGGSPDSGFLIRDGDKVVFYGDSITDSEWYPTLLESYVLTRYPHWRNQFSNRGVSGDNSGSIARFERDVIAQKPDVCTYNMGFNDGGYFGFSSPALKNWLANIGKSVELARRADPKLRMVLVSPIPNEASLTQDPRWISRDVYPYAMLSFGTEEAKLAKRLCLPFVDAGRLYGQSMGLGKVSAGPSFALSRDGVHPQREGQTLIAYHLLRGLGASSQLGHAIIDAANAKVLKADGGKLTGLAVSDGSVAFRLESDSLPCPVPPEARPFAFLVQLDDSLNGDWLALQGLTAPAYSLFVDDLRIADISAEELAEGVNLSRYVDTPMNRQAMTVMEAVRKKQVLQNEFYHHWIHVTPGKADGAGNPLDTATPDERAAMEAARKEIAAAEKAAYALNTPKPHEFRLVPSATPAQRYDFLAAADIAQPRLEVAVSPLPVDWNRMVPTGNEVKVKIRNPAKVARMGRLEWTCGNGWTVTPSEVAIHLEAGRETELSFAVSAREGSPLVPTPEVTLSWHWSDLWAYPMAATRSVELAPKLTIQKASSKPSLTGKIQDWKDATSFTLDQLSFINPAVPGKKPLWDGPADLSAKFFLKWDETALYIAAIVRDDDHMQEASEQQMWSQDCLMVAMLMIQGGKPGEGRYEFGFGACPGRDAIGRYTQAAKDGAGPDIEFKSRCDKADGTCLYELAIPWNRLAPFVPAAGNQFRLTFAVGDSDHRPGKGYNYLAWTPGISYGKNPADFAEIVLGGK
jgi:lysophospholipase L1-like esterase